MSHTFAEQEATDTSAAVGFDFRVQLVKKRSRDVLPTWNLQCPSSYRILLVISANVSNSTTRKDDPEAMENRVIANMALCCSLLRLQGLYVVSLRH
jgi:hypothetical protein